MELHKEFKWLIIIIMVCYSSEVFAQMQKKDWIGTYTMNHDGWKGKLVIEDSKRDCSNSEWCSLNIRYTDAEGKQRKVVLQRFSEQWQRINFQIQFPQYLQPFEGFLFSHDKRLIAGTTTWNNRKFGFYANKQPVRRLTAGASQNLQEYQSANVINRMERLPQVAKVVKRRVLDNGSVELTFSDGTIKVYSGGSITVKNPGGEEFTMSMMQVMTLDPPMPNNPDVNKWLGELNNNMDEIATHLFDGDATSLINYKNNLSDYNSIKRVNESMRIIGFLIN